MRDVGYGRDVRTALAARRQWLIEQQLADGERSAFRYRDGALDTLRQRNCSTPASGSATISGNGMNRPVSVSRSTDRSRGGWISKAGVLLSSNDRGTSRCCRGATCLNAT